MSLEIVYSSVWEKLEHLSVVGVLRSDTFDTAIEQASAAIEGGLKIIEITFTTPGAVEIFKYLQQHYPEVLLGAGTVTTEEQLHQAIAASATFIVSPHLDEDLVRVSLDQGILYVPGVLSPTEIQRAQKLGCTAVKIFPIARAGGPAYVQDLLGPFPALKVMVTGGIKVDEAKSYLLTGAKVIGLGSIFAESPEVTKQRTEQLLRMLQA